MVIGGYFISGYWCLFYFKLLLEFLNYYTLGHYYFRLF
jgi:hypothetical protein